MADIFKQNQKKANAMGVSRFLDEPGYAEKLISGAGKAKSSALKKSKKPEYRSGYEQHIAEEKEGKRIAREERKMQ